MPYKAPIIALLVVGCLFGGLNGSNRPLQGSTAYASQVDPDQERLADAIFKAEGIHSRHPYGILAKYKHTTPRQACLNTIASSMRRWEAAGRPGAFIPWLAKTYCPVGSDTDDGTCRYWPGNVEALYHG